MAQETYRAIIVFGAESDKDAKVKAATATKASGGKLQRLTVRRETWGQIGEETAEAK